MKGDQGHRSAGGTAVMVFTRDLRVRDNPALYRAGETSDVVVPMFVLDPVALGTSTTAGDGAPPASTARPLVNPSCPNRAHFLADCLRDLDTSLRDLGSELLLRSGDWVHEVLRTVRQNGATSIYLADDVSGYARNRLERLARGAQECRVALHRSPGITVVPPGDIAPSGRSAFSVFTPYHRAWERAERRAILPVPPRLDRPHGRRSGSRHIEPVLQDELDVIGSSPDLQPGGERAGRDRLDTWLREGLEHYPGARDEPAADATSRLSPYLHLGCLSPLELAERTRDLPGGAAFTRQLCWRDFFHQVLAARPATAVKDHTDRRIRWSQDEDGFEAWATGNTGYPLVDAGMRQLLVEGFMHNRARMLVASFLTKDLLVDWRRGAAYFRSLLVDGDVASNQLNWQWVVGTGTGNALHRVLSPLRQAQRFDPQGTYIRRYVPELADLPGNSVHDPDPLERRRRGYPDVVVDHAHAAHAFLEALRG